MITISATELARNTREILDSVASNGETVEVLRNQTVVARIIPAQKNMTAAQALDGLKLPALTPEQAAQWIQDSRGDFDQTVRDPWE